MTRVHYIDGVPMTHGVTTIMAPAWESWPQPASTPGEPSPCQGIPKHCLGGNDSGLGPARAETPAKRYTPKSFPPIQALPSSGWERRGRERQSRTERSFQQATQ